MKNYEQLLKKDELVAVHNDPIDSTFMYNVGKGMGTHMVKEYGQDSKMLIGSDVHSRNTDLLIAFIHGLEDAGCLSWTICNTAVESVEDQEFSLGVSSKSFFDWCMKKNFHLGMYLSGIDNDQVKISAMNSSNNILPPYEIGLMIDGFEHYPYEGIEGAKNRLLIQIHEVLLSPSKRITKKRTAYVNHLADAFENVTEGYRIAVDYGSGSCVGYEFAFLQLLEENSPIEIVHINFEADETCENELSLQDIMKEYDCDFGCTFSFDGSIITFGEDSFRDSLPLLLLAKHLA